jgi:MFS family permease
MNWIINKFKLLWNYIYTAVASDKAVPASIACLSWLLVIAFCSSFFITPKPWYIQFSQALLGMGAGAALGVVIGLVIGGIGLALMGTAVGIAGWLVGAIFGATVGGFFGLLVSFVSNPAAYTFHIYKFLLVLGVASVIAYLLYRLALKLFRTCVAWVRNRNI